MTILNKAENIHNNSYVLRRWELPNTPDNPAYVPAHAEARIPIEDIIRRFCAYDLELKDSDGYTHDWCTAIPALDLAYNTSIHASTGKTPEILEKGWNPKLQVDTLKKDLFDINPTASSFNLFLDKVRNNANKSITDAL
ncbi:hypothetical protein O181_026267 [Austropuccinia psidii MF-1]|uniref:Integrase catalytic domain-containing protein n=1 Tax=Austropuccinia psidii MF-1 TaxID=1389203 RepID=A0A9Q3H0M4_9BASI|nr:hypothetical protein [Austropuccinia psidii MF-1]